LNFAFYFFSQHHWQLPLKFFTLIRRLLRQNTSATASSETTKTASKISLVRLNMIIHLTTITPKPLSLKLHQVCVDVLLWDRLKLHIACG
jgi:hypothetical protein